MGDSSQTPRFVETVPKRGYLFIAPVEVVPPGKKEHPAPSRRPWLLRGTLTLTAVAFVAGAVIVEDRFAEPTQAGPVRFTARALNLPDGARDPALSPDGRSIAYVSREDGNSEIYIRGLDARDPFRLTTNPSADQDPVWAPDGSRIAFQRRWPGTGPGTYVASLLDGSKTLVMGQTTGASSWTPDGMALIASGGDAHLQRADLATRTVEALFAESSEGYQRDAAVLAGRGNRRLRPLSGAQ